MAGTRTQWLRALAALAVFGGATACSTAPCTGDPNTDSLSCVQSGISSGQYQRRVNARQAEAADKQRQVEVAMAESDRLQGEIASARKREQVLRAKITGQQAELSRLSADIDRLAAQGDLSPGEVGMRRAQVNYLQQRQTGLQQSPGDDPELQKKAATLQSDIDALSKALSRVKN